MSITLHQQPTTPNGAFADLIWVASSTNQNQPQFQFVATIQASGSSDVITLKQQPNPNGYGVFNMGPIATTLIDYDPIVTSGAWTSASLSVTALKTTFSEEYGTSTSSSVTTYNTITGSETWVIPRVVEPDSGYWNFQSSSFLSLYSTNTALTDSPTTQSIRVGEYASISFLNAHFNRNATNYSDVYKGSIQIYSGSTILYNNQNVYNHNTGAPGGPRSYNAAVDGVEYVDAAPSASLGNRLATWGVGPQNWSAIFGGAGKNWTHYLVDVWTVESPGPGTVSSSLGSFRFERQEAECGYDGTRFAFINDYGVYDYYTFPFANTISDGMTRSEYTQTFVDYSTTYGGVSYNASRRGSKVYNQDYTQNRVAESSYLTQEEADWLKQLVESPEVFIQSGTKLLPVVITNSDFTYKTNPRTQKLYRLTLTYKMANQKRSR